MGSAGEVDRVEKDGRLSHAHPCIKSRQTQTTTPTSLLEEGKGRTRWVSHQEKLYAHSDREDGPNVHLVGRGSPDAFLQTLLAVKGLVANVDIIF